MGVAGGNSDSHLIFFSIFSMLQIQNSSFRHSLGFLLSKESPSDAFAVFCREHLSFVFKANSKVWLRVPRRGEVFVSRELSRRNLMQQD